MTKPLLPMRSVNFDELDPIPTIGFALVTAVDIERDEMRSKFAPLDGHTEILKVSAPEGTYYVGKCGLYPCVLVTCEAGSGGRDGATLAIVDAIDRWRPYAVILVGIAFGRDPKKQVIGDVLISTQVIPYELQRVGAETIYRGPRPEANGTLRDRVRHLDWSWRPDGAPESRRARRGPILSGEKLVDHPEFKAKLFHDYPEAEGGEMEGAGLYAAAARRNVPWIIIKAICDWGENKDKTGHPLAAKNACALVDALLHEPALRARDLGAEAAPSEGRAERVLREQTRRGRQQQLESQIRDAQRRQQERADDHARFIRDNFAALKAPSPSPDLAVHVDTLNSARESAVEQWLNAYNDACAAILHNEVDRVNMLDAIGAEIRELCETEEPFVRGRLHPRERSPYGSIWSIHDELDSDLRRELRVALSDATDEWLDVVKGRCEDKQKQSGGASAEPPAAFERVLKEIWKFVVPEEGLATYGGESPVRARLRARYRDAHRTVVDHSRLLEFLLNDIHISDGPLSTSCNKAFERHGYTQYEIVERDEDGASRKQFRVLRRGERVTSPQ